MKRVSLVGCGNIGSRHLQALVKIPFKLYIDIVEPNSKSKKLAIARLKEIQFRNNHEIAWYTSIEELKNSSDVTVVATNSEGRADLIEKLLAKGHSRFLIEKFVCQSDSEYHRLIEKFNKTKAKGWINTNPRCFRSYQKLKKIFNSRILHFSVTSSNTSALATNSIHYLDLFAYFTENYNIRLSGNGLLPELFPNKRGKNYIEFAGTISGQTKNNSTFSMTFLPSTKIPTIVNIVGENKHIMIDETNGKLMDLTSANYNTQRFTYEYASNLTTKIIADILKKDDCNLTELQDSYLLHKELFRIFNEHIKKITNKEVSLCPIT